jgi:hypothetical protein
MGLQVVVSIKDQASGAYSRPVFVAARGQAVRSFSDELSRPDSELHRHPDDFELHCLALFDDTTGSFVPLADGPECLVRGRDLVSKE